MSKSSNILYTLAKQLSIFPDTLSEEDFEKRFFYLFIERGNGNLEKGFRESLFDEDESQGYAKAMRAAFLKMFQYLAEKKDLSVEMIDELHNICAGDSIPDKQYRKASGTTSGFGPDQTSAKFLEQIEHDKMVAKFELIAGSPGYYSPSSTSLSLVLNHRGDVAQTMKLLVDTYQKKMAEINSKGLREEELAADKIKLIGSLIGDMSKLHPYRDGNGRTFVFALLNYLLIKENLMPCMMFQPWNAAHITSDERFDAIVEGQAAYQRYFIEGKEIAKEPITDEAKAIAIKKPQMSNEQLTKKVIDLFLCYLKIKTLSSVKQDTTDLKLSLRAMMSELTTAPNDIRQLKSFHIPENTFGDIQNNNDFMDMIIISGLLPLLDKKQDITGFRNVQVEGEITGENGLNSKLIRGVDKAFSGALSKNDVQERIAELKSTARAKTKSKTVPAFLDYAHELFGKFKEEGFRLDKIAEFIEKDCKAIFEPTKLPPEAMRTSFWSKVFGGTNKGPSITG